MDFTDTQTLIHLRSYAKTLRPLLPAEAFAPDPSKLVILLINLAILILGWLIAADLDQWSPYLLWLYLPLAVVMGNSVIVLTFGCHDLLHNSVIKNSRLTHIIGLVGHTVLWMPPTLWKTIHNRVHHNQTNDLGDPDRNFFYEHPDNLIKFAHGLLVPSVDSNPIGLIVGMAFAWSIYTFRNLTAVLFFNGKSVNYVPAYCKVTAKERRAIAGEFLVILSLHFSVWAYLQFDPLKLALSYFLPMAIGHAGIIFYIYTNHLVCRLTSVNDPLINSVSLRVPKLFDQLHFNFSHHTEHHIFPAMNSDYYPLVQDLLKTHYPERFNLLDAGEAWRLLRQTPRYYKDENTFTDRLGENLIPCPLNHRALVAEEKKA
jgi:fatty acid desaturase